MSHRLGLSVALLAMIAAGGSGFAQTKGDTLDQLQQPSAADPPPISNAQPEPQQPTPPDSPAYDPAETPISNNPPDQQSPEPAEAPAEATPSEPPQPQQALSPEDAAFEQARVNFESMTLENRILIQRSLVWVTSFNGAAFGTFGKLTYAGIKAYEKKAGLVIDGSLDSEELSTLVSEAEEAQAAVNFEIVEGDKSGVKIGLPLKLLTKNSPTNVGAKYTSADGAVTVETAIGTGTIDDLPAAYDRFLALPNRKVTYKLLKPDFFVVTGEAGANLYYVRYHGNAEGMRGFTFRYPKARQKVIDRYVIAAANTFEPFPGSTPVVADDNGGQNDPPQPDQPSATRIVSAISLGGTLMTAGASACKSLAMGGKPINAGQADANGVVVLSGPGAANDLVARAKPPEAGEKLVVISASASGAPVVSPAEVIATGAVNILSAALPASGAGAAVFDRRGALVGLISGDPAAVKPIAGIMPVAKHAFATISGAGSDQGETLSAGAIAARAGSAIVALSCGT
jgi:hypothetical protein